MEGDDVTIGCYGQYDWLSYWLQYNPIGLINSSIQFLEDTDSYLTITPGLGTGFHRPPPSVTLATTYTIQNVQAGDTIDATCQIDFSFDKSPGYSGRNTYANNTLQWTCSVRQPVSCKYIFLLFKACSHDFVHYWSLRFVCMNRPFTTFFTCRLKIYWFD